MKGEMLLKENLALRKLLWLGHGCEIATLYGDDGEMQCSYCLIDFKRNSPQEIETRLKWREQSKMFDPALTGPVGGCGPGPVGSNHGI